MCVCVCRFLKSVCVFNVERLRAKSLYLKVTLLVKFGVKALTQTQLKDINHVNFFSIIVTALPYHTLKC